MSVREGFAVVMLTVGLSLIGPAGCGGYKAGLCCNSEEIGGYGETRRSYCNDYAVAVAGFLRAPDTEELRIMRREHFKQFFTEVQSCSTIGCIVQAVDSSTLVPDFNAVFDMERKFAQDRRVVSEIDRVDLLLCGFAHGLNVSLQ